MSCLYYATYREDYYELRPPISTFYYKNQAWRNQVTLTFLEYLTHYYYVIVTNYVSYMHIISHFYIFCSTTFRKIIDQTDSPVVFCHNDMQEGKLIIYFCLITNNILCLHHTYITVVFFLLYGSVFGKRDLLAIFSQTRFQRNFPFKRCKPFKNIPDRIWDMFVWTSVLLVH